MRILMGVVAAALVAVVGCGGGGESASLASDPLNKNGYGKDDGKKDDKKHDDKKDDKDRDLVCQCQVNGGGQLIIGGQRFQFDVQAIPESGPAAGPGFGGVGVAAKGNLKVQLVPGGDRLIEAEVDTIVSCTPTPEGGIAIISGALEGAVRFTATVTDGGEPENDRLAVEGLFDVAVENGNIQVHQFENCVPDGDDGEDCPDGQYRDPESMTCKPSCPDGEYLDPASMTCKPSCGCGEFFDHELMICRPPCPDGEYFDKEIMMCRPPCADGEYFDAYDKACKPSCPPDEFIPA